MKLGHHQAVCNQARRFHTGMSRDDPRRNQN